MKTNEVLIRTMLEVAVPLWQLEMCGLPECELRRMAENDCDVICMADALMGRAAGEKPGRAATAFNAVARGIAILSLLPGGVKIFGTHWRYAGPNALNPAQPDTRADGLAQLLNGAIS